MDEITVKRFLRYYWSPLVDFALELAELDENEKQAVLLCGRKRLTIEKAAEITDVSVNTMQSRWSNARKRLCKAWQGIEWIKILADTVEE